MSSFVPSKYQPIWRVRSSSPEQWFWSGQPLILQLNLGHNDVGRREEHSDGGDYGEESERYETEAVEHHCSKLPIILDGSRVFVITYLTDGG